MALICTDIGKLVHPYLDGEFSDEDRVALEQHTAECGACRDLVQYEMAFKASMRTKLSPPKASSSLRRRVLASLDEIDRLQSDSEPRRLLSWLLPTGSMAAAAAAIALFFLYPGVSERAANSNAPQVEPIDTRGAHEERPIPVTTGNADQVRREMSRAIGVPARLPRFHDAGGQPASARVVRLRDRYGAQFTYRFENGDVSVIIFEPRGLRPTRGHKRKIGDVEVLCDTQDGLNRFFYEKDGIGHMVTSELSEADTLRIIRTDLEYR